MTCDEFNRKLPAYLAGSLTEAEAVALEEHAAACATCETRLELASRVPVAATSLTLPDGLRDATLSAVARRRRAQRTTRWIGTITALAAVVVLAFALSTYRASRESGAESGTGTVPPVASVALPAPAPARRDSVPAVAPTPGMRTPATRPHDTIPKAPTIRRSSAPAALTVASIRISDADRFATERSSTEFAALDAAARELEAALARSPDDVQLRSFLASVLARRDELTRRVKAARS